jgi:hypothetical protein
LDIVIIGGMEDIEDCVEAAIWKVNQSWWEQAACV